MSDLPRLVFIVQAHEATDQLEWLIRWLGQQGDLCLLSLDCDPGERFFEGATTVRSLPVLWGGYSSVSAYLDSLTHVLTWPDWDYAINLSGNCFPTKSLTALKDFLQIRLAAQVSLVGTVRTDHPEITSANGFRQAQYLQSDMLTTRSIKLLCQDSVLQDFQEIRCSPVFSPEQRLNYYVEEIPASKTLLVRALEREEADARRQLLVQAPLHFGRAWFCLSRARAEQVMGAAEASPAIALLRHAFIPDELLLPTLLSNSTSSLPIENRNLHAWWGAPTPVGVEQWVEASGEDNFFARKVMPWDFEAVRSAAAGLIG